MQVVLYGGLFIYFSIQILLIIGTRTLHDDFAAAADDADATMLLLVVQLWVLLSDAQPSS